MTNTNSNGSRRALVVGLGISGIATAIRLRQIGWDPVIVERSPERRTGGYFVLLYGAGRASAKRLGFLDGMPNRAAADGGHFEIDRMGNRSRATSVVEHPQGPHQMLRGDVEQAAFDKLPDDVEIRFSTVPARIEQDADGVDVTLHNTSTGEDSVERFALVVGADGVRSTVRRLVFGPPEQYLHLMGRITSAYQLPGPIDCLAPEDSAVLLERGRAAWIFGFRDRNPTVMLTYESDDIDAEFAVPPAQRLREVFGQEPTGKLLGAVLDAAVPAQEANNILFDSPQQVRMDTWHKGRVVLLGDSAWCVTLYVGMGVSAGLSGADLLGTMLEQNPDDLEKALTRWEDRLRPVLQEWQSTLGLMRIVFNPSGRKEFLRRRLLTRGRDYPVVGKTIVKLLNRGMSQKNADVAAA